MKRMLRNFQIVKPGAVMTCGIIEAGRKLIALLLVGASLSALPANAQPQSPDLNALKARVRELHTQTSEVKVTLPDGALLRGHILRVEADSFTIRQRKTEREIALQYAQVKEVKKSGLSRRAKAILIPIAIGGGALLLLCAAPYPIGFLCRKDPS
ncbi:MAG: hypothetical protein JJE04_15320 [Acidobacteriia bacterium]|nr:hypothetical protein [Terriglobia bacterium]